MVFVVVVVVVELLQSLHVTEPALARPATASSVTAFMLDVRWVLRGYSTMRGYTTGEANVGALAKELCMQSDG